MSEQSVEVGPDSDFIGLLDQAVVYNADGLDELALSIRLGVYTYASDLLIKGRAARDVTHSLAKPSRPGGPDAHLNAEWYAEEAIRLHTEALKAGQPNAEYELQASNGELGTRLLAGILNEEAQGQLDWGKIIRTGELLEKGASGSDNDQYTINFIGRLAIYRALFGKRLEAYRDGGTALRLGPRSESSGQPHSNPNFNGRRRLEAKGKAVGRAGVALAINSFTPKPSRPGRHARATAPARPPRGVRRKLARRLAQRAI